jgi:hypothetical protein
MLTFAVINVLSEDNRRILAREDKHTDAVLQLIEPDMPFSIHSTASLYDTTQITLSNISLSI